MYQINVGEKWRDVPVDIIMPYHGQYRVVEESYRSIMTTPIRFRLTMVDDHSPNAAFGESLRKHGINVLRNPAHSGFGASLHAAFAATTSPFVCFLHSDVQTLDPRWLIELQKTLLANNQRTAFVVPKTQNPGEGNEPLRGKLRNYGKDAEFALPVCPLYCFMGLRQTFEKIGLPKPYPYAMYEDDEYSHRIRRMGYRVVISGRSWVQHLGGVTVNNLYKKSKIAEEMDRNRDRAILDMKAAARP